MPRNAHCKAAVSRKPTGVCWGASSRGAPHLPPLLPRGRSQTSKAGTKGRWGPQEDSISDRMTAGRTEPQTHVLQTSGRRPSSPPMTHRGRRTAVPAGPTSPPLMATQLGPQQPEPTGAGRDALVLLARTWAKPWPHVMSVQAP